MFIQQVNNSVGAIHQFHDFTRTQTLSSPTTPRGYKLVNQEMMLPWQAGWFLIPYAGGIQLSAPTLSPPPPHTVCALDNTMGMMTGPCAANFSPFPVDWQCWFVSRCTPNSAILSTMRCAGMFWRDTCPVWPSAATSAKSTRKNQC